MFSAATITVDRRSSLDTLFEIESLVFARFRMLCICFNIFGVMFFGSSSRSNSSIELISSLKRFFIGLFGTELSGLCWKTLVGDLSIDFLGFFDGAIFLFSHHRSSSFLVSRR